MARSSDNVKVRITRDCEGPGDGYKADQEVTVSSRDAGILIRRGFAAPVEAEKAPETIEAKK